MVDESTIDSTAKTQSRVLGDAFARDGYAILPSVFGPRAVDDLLEALPMVAPDRGGTRDLLREMPSVVDLARAPELRAIVEAALGPGAFVVRGILFDKTPAANWKVIWHQDLTIAVRSRCDVHGFGPWTVKDGTPHVQPPVDLLARMIAVRIHLDDCTQFNGPVRVLPGSHRSGRIPAADLDRWRASVPEVVCTVPRGGVLIFHSLLLHASSPAIAPAHRRVVHLEYVGAEWAQLPGGMAWNI
jgi:ectoine hydroxylase-related dioxygenase (phytanoyl-CoA dioxygenase family)